MIKDANYWEDYSVYVLKKKNKAELKKKKVLSKKKKELVLKQHNSFIKDVARNYARDMQQTPSALEEKMKCFLDNKGIIYDFQKVFDIKNREGKIIKFFIADFYIPSRNLIIETDGKFHEEQTDYDEIRTQILQHSYPNIKVIRWKWHDFESLKKLRNLSALLQ